MRYFVFTNYINAFSLAEGLEKLGYKLECYADQSGLLPISKCSPSPGDTLFFTRESDLEHFLGRDEFRYYPRNFDSGLQFDKLAFSLHLDRIGEAPVPFWKELRNRDITFPVCVKARYSWYNDKKLPRGYVCDSPSEVEDAARKIAEDGFTTELFFLQKYVGGDVSNNFSVSGFFDCEMPERSVMIVSRKILGSKGKLPTGMMIRTVPDPENLLHRTSDILHSLNYQGPFELEFLYDAEAATYYVLEFNPRFWMQHGMFVRFFDNLVIKRYLDLDGGSLQFRDVIWINQVSLIKSIALLDLESVRQCFRAYLHTITRRHTHICAYPGWFRAVMYNLTKTKRLRRFFKN